MSNSVFLFLVIAAIRHNLDELPPNGNVSVGNLVTFALNQYEGRRTLVLNSIPAFDTGEWGELEDEILDSLIADERIISFTLADASPGSSLLRVLDRILHKLPHLVILLAPGGVFSTPEAEMISSKLQGCTSLRSLAFSFVGDESTRSLPAVGRCVQDHSSLRQLSIKFELSLPASEEDFKALCQGVAKSSSLKHLAITSLPPAEQTESIERAAEALAEAVAESRSLKLVAIHDNQLFQDRIRHAISRTNAAKNFDLTFHHEQHRENDDMTVIKLHRTNPWKPLLPQNIPLALWSSILAKTNTWNEVTSHTSVDALFFLAREKCDLLFCNTGTKQLSGRKRKREHVEEHDD